MSDLNRLKTEDQSSYVNAINEIVGKRIIANAIGEPLNSLDKWSDIGSDINSLLSTFKTNMMNSGVTVESGDKFKQLIDKIKGLTEGEGNKGIQFAEGTTGMVFTETNNSYYPYTDTATIDIPINLDFEPNIIIITGFRFSQTRNHDGICLINGLDTIIRLDGNSIYGTLKIKEFNKDKITIQISTNNYNYKVSLYSDAATYYAIGVGEEDTALRDTLASILENKGVDVTEEDDIANLITKVDGLRTTDLISGDSFIYFQAEANYTTPGQIVNLTNTLVDMKSVKVSFNVSTIYSGHTCTVNVSVERGSDITYSSDITYDSYQSGDKTHVIEDFKKGDVLKVSYSRTINNTNLNIKNFKVTFDLDFH